MTSEFELIERYFASLTPLGEGILQGPGDDCARVRVPDGCELAISIDTLVEDVHFLAGTDAADIGWKSLACGLSDLAAMGASPSWCTLALTVPRADESWLAGFAEGFGAIAREYGMALVGGDVTRGRLTISVQVAGHLRSGHALVRGGARSGDAVCVSGTPGEAAAGLARLQAGTAEAEDPLVRRLNRPTPRVALGARLAGRASACIDVSDGLAADLGHILAASGVGARIDLDALPPSDALRRAAS
ncbi:MAG: thiamine-phosphate kinase, partial [Halofilum sp. (in: g-proteobacteria)]